MPTRIHHRSVEAPPSSPLLLAWFLGGAVVLAGCQGGTGGGGRPDDGPSGPGTNWEEVCGGEQLPAAGVHHFCDCGPGASGNCKKGDDLTGDGSEAHPWQTWDKVNGTWRTMPAGDTIALCRGGAWTNTTRWADDSWTGKGTGEKPLTLRDYASPDFSSSSRPLVNAGGFIFRRASHLRVMNLALDGTGSPEPHWGFSSGTGQSDWTICNLTISNFDIGVYVEANDGVPGVRILGNRFDRNAGDGILAGGPGLVIDGNVFTKCGGASGRHSIYIGATLPGLAEGMQVINNRIVSPGVGDSPFVAHGYLASLRIENNLLDDTAGSTGWNWDLSGGGYPHTCGLPDLVFRRNRVIGGGNVGVRVEQAPRALIEDNILQMTGGEATGIELAAARTCTEGGEVTTAVTVRNNTIYLPHHGVGIGMDVGEGNVVTSNAISGSGVTCFSGTSYGTEDYNLCDGAWGRARGAHDKAAAPMFTGPLTPDAAADFTPAPGSPLIGGASPVAGESSPTAATSVAWSPNDSPKVRAHSPTDIGAYER